MVEVWRGCAKSVRGDIDAVNEYLSNKFRWMSFFATWAVVCIHSRTCRWDFSANDWANSCQYALANLFHFAVPLFFVISGFMFVSSYERYGWRVLLHKKLVSLYVPFVLWTYIGACIIFPVKKFLRIWDFEGWKLMCFPFLITETGVNNHFWYIRALIILFVLSPIAMFLAKRCYFAIVVMCLPLLTPFDSAISRMHIPTTLFFFLMGSLIAVHLRDKIQKVNSRQALNLFVLAVMALALSTIFRNELGIGIYRILINPFLMIVLLWTFYDVLADRFGELKFPERANCLFAVYCMHLIFLFLGGGMWRTLLGVGPWSRFLGYLFLWQTFWIDLVVANLIKTKLPRLYIWLAGGR